MIRGRRVLALAAVGLLVVASIASAQSKKPRSQRQPARPAVASDSDVVLARVGNEVITPRTVRTRLDELPEPYRAQYTTPEGKQQILDRLIEERVWTQEAVKNGVPDRPAVKQQLEQQKRDLILRTWVNELMAKNPAPTDEQVKEYYDEHLSEFRTPATVNLKHIQTRTEADARKALAATRVKGAKWEDVVKKFSTDTLTRATGGSLGTVTREGAFSAIGMQPELAAAGLSLGEGEIGGPFKTDRGWHVIRVEKKTEDTTKDLDQVKSFIVQTLTRRSTQDYYTGQLSAAKARLGVKADSAAIKNFLSARKSAREMFEDAKAAATPEQRLQQYRQVVTDWPASDVAPQALFMVGFTYSEEYKNYDEAEKAFRELLQKYPKSELAASAQWMVEHMRTEDAPAFLPLEGDSAGTAGAHH